MRPGPNSGALDALKPLPNYSIPFHSFSVFPITWKICSSLYRQPKSLQQLGFWNSFGSVREQVPCFR